MFGLTVRWAWPTEVEGDDSARLAERLRDYVVGTSLARFEGRPGLRFKTWRMVPGEWFEGCYVWESAAARDDFATEFSAIAATSPGSELMGSSPLLIEPCEIVAIAEGGSGFSSGAGSPSA